jgi:hypothetical protein
VIFVYRDEESLKNDQRIDAPRPHLKTFLTEQSALFRMMSDGPM